MGVSYTNRMGRTYYLREGTTHTGKPRYWFSTNLPKALVEKLPEGYEIYEHPEKGQVFLRRKRPRLIGDLEKLTVEQGIKNLAGLAHFIVSIEDDSIVVYLPDLAASQDLKFLSICRPAGGPADAGDAIRRSAHSKVMRFVLKDPVRRRFVVQRWCFRGAIDSWIFLAGPASLPRLVGKYVPHLGRESFYDLL